MKNPNWTRDELILALDLYFRLDYGQMDGRNSEVIELSHLLGMMNETNDFDRSANSVSLKLANFKRIDPYFSGKGMKSGSKLELEIWYEFANDRPNLIKDAQKLRQAVIKRSITDRKKRFMKWLIEVGKPDGTDYQKRTVQVYAKQVENSIVKEFAIEVNHPGGIYGIRDLSELKSIEIKLGDAEDSKKRRDLRSAYHNYLRFISDEFELNDSFESHGEIETRTEGGTKVYLSRRAERDLGLRNKARAIHGTSCQACGFDFIKFYGEWGKDFIEVHHLIPLAGSKTNKVRETNPATDLCVLCSNCHRMVHRKKTLVLSLQELKNKIQKQTE